jgi:hypothetical protein
LLTGIGPHGARMADSLRKPVAFSIFHISEHLRFTRCGDVLDGASRFLAEFGQDKTERPVLLTEFVQGIRSSEWILAMSGSDADSGTTSNMSALRYKRCSGKTAQAHWKDE